jgi:hypothetical protein
VARDRTYTREDVRAAFRAALLSRLEKVSPGDARRARDEGVLAFFGTATASDVFGSEEVLEGVDTITFELPYATGGHEHKHRCRMCDGWDECSSAACTLVGEVGLRLVICTPCVRYLAKSQIEQLSRNELLMFLRLEMSPLAVQGLMDETELQEEDDHGTEDDDRDV